MAGYAGRRRRIDRLCVSVSLWFALVHGRPLSISEHRKCHTTLSDVRARVLA